MHLIVQKYGGTSVATAERIHAVAERIARKRREGSGIAAVVSARGGMTDELIRLAQEITDRPPRREMDMLLATGEQISVALLAMALDKLDVPAISLTGAQGGIRTDQMHTKARIRAVDTGRLVRELESGKVVIVAGFQGMNEVDDITTLGRGGSDTTAVALAAALGADICEIFTDVDGVYTADPRIVPGARLLPRISYGEMLEMASLGAGVLQPRSVEVAAQHHVRIEVRSSFNHNPGTIVEEVGTVEKDIVVVGVTHDANVVKVIVADVPDRPGLAHRIFAALADARINVDVIVQTTKGEAVTDLIFTVSRDERDHTVEILERISGETGATRVEADESVAKVSIVGAGMVSNPGVAARMFGALSREGINIQVISTSEIKVSCLIAADAATRAVRAIHEEFELGEAGSDGAAGESPEAEPQGTV